MPYFTNAAGPNSHSPLPIEVPRMIAPGPITPRNPRPWCDRWGGKFVDVPRIESRPGFFCYNYRSDGVCCLVQFFPFVSHIGRQCYLPYRLVWGQVIFTGSER